MGPSEQIWKWQLQQISQQTPTVIIMFMIKDKLDIEQRTTCEDSLQCLKKAKQETNSQQYGSHREKSALLKKFLKSALNQKNRRLQIPEELIQKILMYLFKSPYTLQKDEYCLSLGSLLYFYRDSCFVRQHQSPRQSITLRKGSELILGVNYPFTIHMNVREIWELPEFDEFTDILKKVNEFIKFIRKATHRQKIFVLPQSYSTSDLELCQAYDPQNSPQKLANILGKLIQCNYIKIDLTHNISKKKVTYIIMKNSVLPSVPELRFNYCSEAGWQVQSDDLIWTKEKTCSRESTIVRAQYQNQFLLLEGQTVEKIEHYSDLPQKLGICFLQSLEPNIL